MDARQATDPPLGESMPHCNQPVADSALARGITHTSRRRKRCNLVLVARPRRPHLYSDFRRIAEHIRQLDPEVHPRVLWDTRYTLPRPGLFLRPTVVVSPQTIKHLAWCPGTHFQADLLTKSEEYAALQKSGIPVPEWALLTRDHRPKLETFGPYVVCKPDAGAKGAEVKIKRTGRVRWTSPANNLARRIGSDGLIVQKFIYTGPWPVSYRVTTLFGKALFSWRVEADRSRRPLQGPDQWRGGAQGGGMSICSSGKACTFQLNNDREIIELAERAHAAFPQIAVLGVDIIREQPSGKLYVIEVNSTGGTWHFSSATGESIQRDAEINFESQFGGLRTAAQVLVEKTHQAAA